MLTEIEVSQLSVLRDKIKNYETGKRLNHTLGVEREITRLCAIYAPELEYELRSAALLHDITKQLTFEKQLQLCEEFGIIYSRKDRLMPKTFHAKTAYEVIRRDFPEFMTETVLSAVLYHTTGKADMTIGEKLLFLADYIDDTRTFEDCLRLRSFFYEGIERLTDDKARYHHLNDTLIFAFDMTVKGLIDEGSPIHNDTFEARNYLIEEREFEQE